jgi:hypothetical protein
MLFTGEYARLACYRFVNMLASCEKALSYGRFGSGVRTRVEGMLACLLGRRWKGDMRSGQLIARILMEKRSGSWVLLLKGLVVRG